MTKDQTEYSDYEYNALGHFLRQQMFGVELTEQEQIEAAMAILKFDNDDLSNFFEYQHKPGSKLNYKQKRIHFGGKLGIIHKDKGWLVFPKYSDIGKFLKNKKYALIRAYDTTYWDKLYGAINDEYEVIIPPLYEGIERYRLENGEDLLKVTKKDKVSHRRTKGLFDLTGKEIIPPIYWTIQEESLSKIRIVSQFIDDRNLKYGAYIDDKLVVPLIYDKTEVYSCELIKVMLKGKVGLINIKGEIVCPIIYDDIYQENNTINGFIRVKLGSEQGFLNPNKNYEFVSFEKLITFYYDSQK